MLKQINKLILDESTSVLATPEPEALAEAVKDLIDNNEKRNTLGKNGRKLYEQKYNFHEYSKRLAACYNEILQ